MEKTPGGEPAAPNSCHVAQTPYAVCSSDSPPQYLVRVLVCLAPVHRYTASSADKLFKDHPQRRSFVLLFLLRGMYHR